MKHCGEGFAVSLCRLGIDGWEFRVLVSALRLLLMRLLFLLPLLPLVLSIYWLKEECLMVQGFDACTAILPLRHAHQF